MCGITGFLGHPQPDLLSKMTDSLRHRGPTSGGHHTTADVSLGVRRLAIQDVLGGDQPIHNETGDVTVIFNGEIYNFAALRGDLERRGHRFRTRTDTEVLVHLYEEEGPNLAKRLNGMYAFALWDNKTKMLHLARDPLGIKPLYYMQHQGAFYFASEIKALLLVPGTPRALSPEALSHYMAFNAVPDPLSVFAHIKKLPGGHWLCLSAQGLRETVFWTPPAPDPAFDPVDLMAETERLLSHAVEGQLVSDVPLGVSLSGGLDSSALVAFAAPRLMRPLKTFSIGFARPDDDFNETDKARLVARRFGTDHSEFILSPRFDDMLPALVRAFDEPFGNSSVLPTYLLCQEAARHVKVLLTGVGGDELFAGYPRYGGLLLAEKLNGLPFSLRRALTRLGPLFPDQGGSLNWPGRLRRFINALDKPLARQYETWTANQVMDILPPPTSADGAHETPSSLAQKDLTGYLSANLLCLTDRVGMFHSLEVRVPFLDQPLVDWMSRLPLNKKMPGRRLKGLLKKILRSHLPKEILNQPKKGFSIPLARWLRHNLRDMLEDALAPHRLKARGFFDPAHVQRLKAEHLGGRHNHADFLWSALMLELWCRTVMDS